MDVLEHTRVRFTQPGDFNDPFEFRPFILGAMSDPEVRAHLEQNLDQLVETELAKYGALLHPGLKLLLRNMVAENKAELLQAFQHLQPQALEKLSPSIDELLNQSVGVFCLSEVPDSILMWGHYTNNHRGFVVGFDSTHTFFLKQRSEQDEFGFLRRVNYQRERPKVVLSDTSSPVWFQTKCDEWAYEKEWRMLRVLSESDHRISCDPFPVYLFDFPVDAVLQIIVGLRSEPALVEQIKNVTSKFPNATLLGAREDPATYSLVLQTLS